MCLGLPDADPLVRGSWIWIRIKVQAAHEDQVYFKRFRETESQKYSLGQDANDQLLFVFKF
jgi:hypothetical protein